MGSKGGRAPPPPDPNVVTDATVRGNRETATYNNAMAHGNTVTPYGNQTFTGRVDPTTGATVYDQTITLSPDQQALLDSNNAGALRLGQTATGLLDRVRDAYGQPMDTSGAPQLQGAPTMGQFGGAPQLQGYNQAPGMAGYQGSINASGLPGLMGSAGQQENLNTAGLPGLTGNAGQSDQLNINGPGIQGTLSTDGLSKLFGANDLMGARQQTQDALYGRQAAFLDPQWQQREEATRTRAATQGIVEGSEAWNNLMDAEGRSRSFDYGRARESAIAGGGDELSRLVSIAQGNRGQQFNERQAQGGFQNNAQAQALSQALAQGNFGNNARQTNAAFQNAARGQGFNEAVVGGNFANDARQTNAGFQNAARGQGFNEALAGGNFANDATAAGNRDAMAGAAFNQAAIGQGNADAMAQANFNQNATAANNQAGLQAAAFGNDARAQALQELFALRNQPLNEYSALTSGAQVNAPNFQNPNVSRSADVDAGANINRNYDQRLNIWNAQQQSNNNFLSGLFGLGGAALSNPALFASDERLKTEIERVGDLPQGVGVYDYEYKDEPGKKYTGVMAQEVERVQPDAVSRAANGYRQVDYGKVLAEALRRVG